VQDEPTRGSRDGECLWKQSNIGESLEGAVQEKTIFDFIVTFQLFKCKFGSKNAFWYRTWLSNKNLVSRNWILGLANFEEWIADKIQRDSLDACPAGHGVLVPHVYKMFEVQILHRNMTGDGRIQLVG
jgi:hypothetical protein